MHHLMSQQFSQMCPWRKSKMLILLRIQNLQQQTDILKVS